MDNEEYLKLLQNSYDSLKDFSINDNRLILHLDKEYKIHLTYTKLSDLDPDLFLLKPKDILHIIYMLELLPKNNLNDNEIKFINDYTKYYLEMSTLSLDNNQIDQKLVWGFDIPIYSSYDPNYIHTPCSKIIQELLNKHIDEIENNFSNTPRLVLTNPNFKIEQEFDPVESFEKAGFTTLFLIAGAIISTCIYIIYFIVH